jgi:rhodanese-related sulfurtransferase
MVVVRMKLFDRQPARIKHSCMDHAPGFLNLVNDAKKRVNEISVAEARARLGANSRVVLMDVREDHEWQKDHAAEAVHLGKGILERDLETTYPDKNVEIIMYCGGGFRSALTADAALKMGYRNIHSLIGGYKGMVAAGWPMKIGG